jgi:hypothetical protein
MKTENRTAEEIEAYQSWEDNNRNHRSGINPEAYILGYKTAKNKEQSTITQLREELDKANIFIKDIAESIDCSESNYESSQFNINCACTKMRWQY